MAVRSRNTGNRYYDLLPPEPASAKRAPITRAVVNDAVDAEFQVLPRHAPMSRPHPTPMNTNRQPDLLAKATERTGFVMAHLEEGLRDMPASRFYMLVIWAALAMFFLVSGIVGIAGPRREAEVPGLSITHVTVHPSQENGLNLTEITGIIENRTAIAQSPRLLAADFYAGDTLVSHTEFAVGGDAIAPGKSRGFATRLTSVGGKLQDVRLSVVPEAVPAS